MPNEEFLREICLLLAACREDIIQAYREVTTENKVYRCPLCFNSTCCPPDNTLALSSYCQICGGKHIVPPTHE